MPITGMYQPASVSQVYAYEWTGNPNDLSHLFTVFDNCGLQLEGGQLILSVQLSDMVVFAKPAEVIVADEDFEKGEAIPYKEFVRKYRSVHDA